jgi:predicted ATPase
MITHVTISNYRCFRHVDVVLAPLTVLIGPNNSGKTAFLTALNLLQDVGNKISETDRWMLDENAEPSIAIKTSQAEVVITENSVNGRRQKAWKVNGDINQVLPIRFFSAKAAGPSMVSDGVSEREGIPAIDNNISNVPAVLDSLLRKDRSRFDRILDTLRHLVPGLKDIQIVTPDAAHRRIDLVLENDLTINASLVSFGVKWLVFFVVLANHPAPPKLILLEEPENGVHPKRLADIIALLSGLSEGQFADAPTQVVLTTHSPHLLDSIDISKHAVLVAQREIDGERTISAIDSERLKFFLDEFALGEVWLNREESGLLRKSD